MSLHLNSTEEVIKAEILKNEAIKNFVRVDSERGYYHFVVDDLYFCTFRQADDTFVTYILLCRGIDRLSQNDDTRESAFQFCERFSEAIHRCKKD